MDNNGQAKQNSLEIGVICWSYAALKHLELDPIIVFHEEGYKALIVGEGGDEVLGGYNRMFMPYFYNNYLKHNKQIPLLISIII